MHGRSTKQRRAAMFRRGQYRIAADNPRARWSRWSDGRLYATALIEAVKQEVSLRQRAVGGMDALVYRPATAPPRPPPDAATTPADA